MKSYTGYQQADLNTFYASFYDENVQPAGPGPQDALKRSPLPPGALPGIEQAAHLINPGYTKTENGYTLEADGSARLAILTPMPGVRPEMWAWWFAWHGDLDNKYKLWHPRAHLSARWRDGGSFNGHYIGRTSLIEEYIGPKLEKAAIQFTSPASLGIPQHDPQSMVFICARLGYSQYPVDFGWLVHQIRATPEGAEMRSRFWIGGPHVQLRIPGAFPGMLSKILQKWAQIPSSQAEHLLQHCAEEMPHLAAFLPDLYQKATETTK